MVKADVHKQDKLFREKFEEILEGIHPDDREDVRRFCESAMMDGIGSSRLLKYLFTLRPLSRELGKSFREAGEDDIRRLILSIEMGDFSEWSKHDKKVILRKYLRFIGKGDLVEDLRIKPVRTGSKLPDEILTEEEIKAMAGVAYNTRDRAFVLALYESGCRIGEFLPLRLKHLEFDQYGAVLHVHGKTGSRRVRLITSAPALQAWLEEHPIKDDPDAYLWRKIPTQNNPKWKNEHLSYGFVARTLRQLAKKAGVKKRVNPHSFRHARATHLASHLTEAQMKEYFGWEQSSEMAAVYVHLSGRDVDDALLAMHGIRDEKRKNGTAFKPEICPRCGEVNEPGVRFCKRCYLPLDGDYSREERLEVVLVSFLEVMAKKYPEVKRIFYDLVKAEGAENIFE
ncbi:MAG: hypothetical protein CW694_00480 [Candidatus Syntrophoarchaeum sp. WYZ-LMO15]|nr:MAG: hypothetical protein CW694_00480 [Candidatus Syntrophoarchaeum sp. WYZ-LMO15]